MQPRSASAPTVFDTIEIGDPEALADADALREFAEKAARKYREGGAAALDIEDLAAIYETLEAADAFDGASTPQAGGGGCVPGSSPSCPPDGGDGGGGDGGGGDGGGGADTGGDDGLGDGGGGDDGPPPPPPGEECDEPEPPDLQIIQCSLAEEATIRAAWSETIFMGWRFHQLLEHVRAVHHDVGPAAAEAIWTQGEVHEVSLSHYFGAYSLPHLEALDDTVRFVFDNRLSHDDQITVACFEPIKLTDGLRLITAKLASPCHWAGIIPGVDPLAHAAYAGLRTIHPDYPQPTYEVCDAYFTHPVYDTPRERGMILFHEQFHWLENSFGKLRDRHNEPECGDKHCNSKAEIHALAWAKPDLGVVNIYAYNEFASDYASLYFNGLCEELDGYCFTSPWCPTDDGGGAPPIPEECGDMELGECEWGACAEVDTSPTHNLRMDPFSAAHPDGNFSKDTYCMGADLVCNAIGGEGRCMRCQPGHMLGCPCDSDSECDGDGLTCWGSDDAGWTGSQGFCWDPVEGPPPFQCDEGCTGRSDYIGNADYFCYHDTNVVEKAVCVTADCNNPPAFCANQGIDLVCDGMSCVGECTDDSDCGETYGWPAGTLCDAPAKRCVTP